MNLSLTARAHTTRSETRNALLYKRKGNLRYFRVHRYRILFPCFTSNDWSLDEL